MVYKTFVDKKVIDWNWGKDQVAERLGQILTAERTAAQREQLREEARREVLAEMAAVNPDGMDEL